MLMSLYQRQCYRYYSFNDAINESKKGIPIYLKANAYKSYVVDLGKVNLIAVMIIVKMV